MKDPSQEGMTKDEFDTLEKSRQTNSADYDGDPIVVKKIPMTKSIEEINRDNQANALARRTKKRDIVDYTKMAKTYNDRDPMIKDVVSDADIEKLRKDSDEYEANKMNEEMNDANDEYNEVDKETDENDYKQLTEEEEIMNQSPSENIPDPEIITAKSFIDEYPDYEKTTIHYYAEDDVLVDENDEPINHVELVVGYDSLNHFGELDEEDNLLYVRNFKFEIDYEIIKHDEKYHVDIRR